MKRNETPQEKFARLHPEAVERQKQKREQAERQKQERQAIFEDILNRMSVKELHALQCRISEMMYEKYKDVCSDCNDMLRYR